RRAAESFAARRAELTHDAELAPWAPSLAHFAAMLAKEKVGIDQPLWIVGQLRNHGRAHAAIGASEVRRALAVPDPLQHAKAVRLEAEHALRPREHQNAVGAGVGGHR